MRTQVKIRYKCHNCNCDRVLEVPKRLKATDVGFWLNQLVMPRVGVDHSKLKEKTGCKSTKVDLLIPVGKDTDLSPGPIGSYTSEDLVDHPVGDYTGTVLPDFGGTEE